MALLRRNVRGGHAAIGVFICSKGQYFQAVRFRTFFQVAEKFVIAVQDGDSAGLESRLDAESLGRF